MKSEIEIQNLREKFIIWLEAEEGSCGSVEDVVRTADTTQDFQNACIEFKRIRRSSMDGLPVTIIEASQRRKGEPRVDLYVLDVDADTRLVYS